MFTCIEVYPTMMSSASVQFRNMKMAHYQEIGS